jgi:allantoinase
MTSRAPGMDHDLYGFDPIVSRKPCTFNGLKTAMHLVLHLEYWELCPPPGSYREPRLLGELRTSTFPPEIRNWTTREYGNRIGIYRIFDLLDKLGLEPCVALGAAMVQTHPELVREVRDRGWEVVSHGFSANRMITSRMEADNERQFICDCQEMVATAIGKRPEGWLSQDFGTTEATTSILHELGFTYTLDWANDALPYWQCAGANKRALISIPGPTELDDVQQIVIRQFPPERFPDLVEDMLTGCAKLPHASVNCIGIHPWVMGTPHRFPYLHETLRRIANRKDFFFTTPGEIARRFISNH